MKFWVASHPSFARRPPRLERVAFSTLGVVAFAALSFVATSVDAQAPDSVQCGDSVVLATAAGQRMVGDTLLAPHESGPSYHAQPFSTFAMRTIGPIPLLRSAAMAGLDQWRRQPAHWTQTGRGYRDRLDSHFGGEVIGHATRFAIERLMQEQPAKYRPCDCVGFASRLTHALQSPFRVETPRGERYSAAGVAGDILSSLVVTAVRPGGFSLAHGAVGGVGSVASTALNAMAREFWPWHWRPPGL